MVDPAQACREQHSWHRHLGRQHEAAQEVGQVVGEREPSDDGYHRPRLLTDDGASSIAGDLAEWLVDRGTPHIRGAPCHPQTQGKIERWHRTLKNRILLENHYLPGALEEQVGAFVEYYNHARAHESLSNLAPADVYFGRGEAILLERERIKRRTLASRRLHHRAQAA